MIRPNPFLPSGSSFSIYIPLSIFSHTTVRLRPCSSCLARQCVVRQRVATMRRQGVMRRQEAMRRQAMCRHNASSGGNASSRGHASPGNVSSQCVVRGDGDYRESVVAMRRQRVPQVMPSCGCPEFSSVWHHVLTYQEAAQITKKVPKSCKNAGRKMPNWCPTASRLGSQLDPWIGKNPLPQHLRPYFPLRRPTLAPIFLFRAPAV